MRYSFILSFILIVPLWSCSQDKVIAEINSGALQAQINDKGAFVSFTDSNTGKEYISVDTLSPVLSLRIDGKFQTPNSARYESEIIELDFDEGLVAKVKLETKEDYFTLELLSLSEIDRVDIAQWGPYGSTIDGVIGETVGVVRNDEFALGIQSLNIKTLGGYPWNESDRMPAFDIFREGDSNNMRPESDGSVLYRVEAAKPMNGGSSLQAYTRNRSKERVFEDFNHEKILAPAYDDGGVVGSKIAIFGSHVDLALQTIGTIEIVEGLPHPMIDGEWAKTSKKASSAYLITSFTEANVEDAIALTKKAGLEYLYHYGKTFESWGHFELYKGEFPNGRASLRNCVELAEAQGVKIGTHCLSNFVQTNDPYVTPIPDPRLAKVGTSTITSRVEASDREIPIASADFFNQMKNNNLQTVMIGEELIRYGSVSKTAPWKLLDCQRGAFGTQAIAHEANSQIGKLLDHGYKVFLTEASLTEEMSETLAELYNETGLRQISFDGLEGNRSTGLGTYGESLMPYTWYNSLSDELKEHLIIDASRTTHFFWHIYTRMNWGEPWYAGFRESQTEYRFNNQAYFQRNYMPGMLGWFKLTPQTSIEDIQWMLAKSAGYDAGYALVADLPDVNKNGNSEQILALIGDWEKLRLSGSFSEEQKMLMRDTESEFAISRKDSDTWNWREIYADIFYHKHKVRQPGEPLSSSFTFENPSADQLINFDLKAENSSVNQITIELNNFKKIEIPLYLDSGQILRYEGGNKMVLLDENWNVIKEMDTDPSLFEVRSGENTIVIDGTFETQNEDSQLKLEVKTQGSPVEIRLKS
ncbi:hypothetical protein ACFOSV_09235 [Algoriphagus namhaensis]|uniref:Uncharacterized protein n=1 Tax=Algoriphagus namhaensis TaxID=915353 RepID=A0ABV8ARS2_9BACT